MTKLSALLKTLTAFTLTLFAGYILERYGPPLPLQAFQWPVNIIILSLFTCTVVGLQSIKPVSAWLSSSSTLISALAMMTIEVMVLGIFPQTHLQDVLRPSLWGFHSVLSSWPWFISQVLLLLVLGSHISKQIVRKDFTSLGVLQLGAWIVLIGAQLGYVDMERCWVRVAEGNRADIAFDSGGKAIDLGFSISLQDFIMEEYAPKIFTVIPQPEGQSPKKIESQRACHRGLTESLGEYEIAVEKYLPYALRGHNDFFPSDTGLTVHAAFVTAKKEGKLYSGWLSSGINQMKPHGLFLEDSVALFMDRPKPKSYSSTIVVKDSISLDDTLSVRVNKPMKVKGWKIYQRGFDKSRGRWSRICVLELVRDPWLPFVYSGIFMIIAGALLFLFSDNRKENQ